MAMQSDQEFAPTQIARAVFPTAFRGYDQDAVRRYLSRLAAALEHQQEYAGLGELEARTPAHERVEELEAEVDGLRSEIKDLELELVQRSVNGDAADGEANPGAHDASEAAEAEKKPRSEVEDRAFDEHRAIELLGQETARVLESARSAAADILKRAETQAASLKAEAKAELEEAKRRAEALVADKQAASDELVAKLASEAEATAERITTEAEEHRTAVLEESSKILTEAEELAESEQEAAQGRAKQIVADAETLRQQVISELVAERRLAQADMDRMTSARDRLAMSLAVARTELDEVADALVDVSNVSFDDASEAPIGSAAAGPSHAEEVEELIGTLDPNAGTADPEAAEADTQDGGSSEAKGEEVTADGEAGGSGGPGSSTKRPAKGKGRGRDKSKRSKRRKDATATAESSTVGSDGGGTDDAKKPVSASFNTGSARFEQLKRDTASGDQLQLGDVDLEADSDAPEPDSEVDVEADPVATESETAPDSTGQGPDELVTGSALLMDDAAEQASTGDESEVAVEQADEVDPDEPIDLDRIIEMGLAAEVIGPKTAEDSAASDLNTPPADGQELSLVQGFTTIDLTDGDDGVNSEDIDLTKTSAKTENGSGPAGGVEEDPELVHSVVVNEPRIPEEMITTVSSRTAAGQPDRTRGDLLIDEPFTGRLGNEFAARDLALTRSGPNFRRQLRRALNDDQSDVLDRLRAGRGNISVDELPAFGEQIDRYLTPLRRGLAEIAQAGATAGGQSDLSQTALDNLVRQLARYIVDKVREPTVAVVEATSDHDRERILEPIRTLYRDFRNVGLPDLTEDALYEAFAIGLYDSIEPSAPISWVVDPRSDPDPVCEINRQRDDVVKGVVFPSGHARPLSLPGCRCLVMLADY